jgi:GT2 family glycosyltransferase
VAPMRAAIVVPNWNGRRWLPGLLASIAAQTVEPADVVVVDNGSTDGSLELLRERGVRTLALGRNTGFAHAANRGIAAAAPAAEAIALLNTDVELEPDWLERASGRLAAAPSVGSVATKMVLLDAPGVLDDAGDELRRDGVAHQRGHGRRDDGRWDTPGQAFSACAGAALYRRAALEAVGGFDERLFSYLEDVELGLRLRLAGWDCAYEPAVARHARHGSAGQLERSVDAWVARNTLLLVAKAFPLRWVGPVAYRQAAWIVQAAREGGLREHLRGLGMALPVLPAMLRERRSLRRRAVVPIEQAVPALPWRGPRAGGHPEAGY